MKPKGSIFKRYECCDKCKENRKAGGPKGKHLKGCVMTGWWARVTYTDPETRKPKDLQRRAESKANAIDKRDELVAEIKETAGQSVGSEGMTFADLCAYYEKHYAKEAEYDENKIKVAGLRSLATVKTQIRTLKDHFGERPLRSLTHGNIQQFRDKRRNQMITFKDEDKAPKKRATASVNRELSLLHKMLNVALAQSWILKNPFALGESLISHASERKRERILTQTEEKTLLEACSAPKRGHLRAIIIAALDTGCRLGELLKLRWRDVGLDTGLVTIIAFNSKTAQARTVGLTTRLRAELEQLKAVAPPDSDHRRVFGILTNVKRAFTGARNDAGLPDLRFHDLRHSNATRQVRGGIPLAEVGRNLGHAQANTTYRYVNADHETAQRAATALDAFNLSQETTETESVN